MSKKDKKNKKRKVIIDCDPGHDDAIALLLAFASSNLNVQGVTVVAGNHVLEKTTYNALKVLEFAGIETEVYAGYDAPLIRDLITAPDVHGESGLDGPKLPEPKSSEEERHAVRFLQEKLRRSQEPITLIPTGPLTNIGAALAGAPDIAENIAEIIFMGGAVQGGNRTAAAEFNILVDPEAAHIVVDSDIEKTMVGLDVTRKAQFLPEDIEELKNLGNPVAEMAGELLEFFVQYHIEQLGMEGCPLHDPLAVAGAIDDSVLTTEKLPVKIECEGRYTTGSTVVDFDGKTFGKANVKVAREVDRIKFIHMVKKLLAKY